MRQQSLILVSALLLAGATATAQRSRAQETQLLELIKRSPAAAAAAAPELGEVYVGPVEVTVLDDFERGASTTVYRFRREGVEVSAYQSTADAPQVRCGDIVRIEGVRLGKTMGVSRARVARRGAAGAGCSSVGEQNVAVILATFPGVAPPATSGDALQRMIFDRGWPSVSSWYRATSYSKASFSGSVFGPFTLDRAYSCAETSQMRDAAIRAADRAVDFTRYQRFILIYPAIRDCQFGGMGTLGCVDLATNDGVVRGSWTWAGFLSDEVQMTDLLIHEMGHNLGVGHSQQLRFPGEALAVDDFRAVPVEYGDSTSAMGRGRFGDFAAAHKQEMGWLEAESDVVTVEQDGEFVLAPLGKETGVRALRVRRRVGSQEWLWLEYRRERQGLSAWTDAGTNSGFDGVLVRRETAGSGVLTQLLDMTPATLDQARLDFGETSEMRPELRSGATWVDPHSELRISVGEAGAEGISVAVRYEERCAVPEVRRLELSAEQQELGVPVAAGPECEWQVSSGRSWLSVARTDSGVSIAATEVTDQLRRSGLVTIGRHTVEVVQKGPERDLEIVSVSPTGPEMPVNAAVPFLIYLRDANGAADVENVLLSVVGPAGSCYFRYSSVRRVVEVSEDGIAFSDGGAAGVSGACGLEGQIYRVNATDVIFRFSLRYEGAENEALTVAVSTEDAEGVRGPWLTAAEMVTTSRCRALPAIDYFQYQTGGGTNQSLTVRASASPCEWTAWTDAPWIRLGVSAGSDGGTLRFDVETNRQGQSREGRIFINNAPVRVLQYGNGEIVPHYVTLRPTETAVSSLPGRGFLTFFYGLGNEVPAVPEVDWLTVVGTVRSADRREIWFQFAGNEEGSPRVGTIVVGGKRFTVVQEGRQVERPASGGGR